MINRITIKNFKGINSLKFAPKKFNIIVGGNNTGKTSIIEAISICMNPYLLYNLSRNKYQNSVINYLSDKSTIKIDIENNKVMKLSFSKSTPDQILNLLKNDLSELFNRKDEVCVGIDKNVAIEKIIKGLDKNKIYQASLDSIIVLVNYSDHQIILAGESYRDLLTYSLSKLYDIYISKNAKDSIMHTSNGDILENEYMMKHEYMITMLSNHHELSRKNSLIKYKKDNVTFIKNALNSMEHINKNQKLALQLENIIKHDNIISNLKGFNFDSLVLDTEDGDKEIPIESMGDGFKSLIYIFTELYENESNIILIEEPENYMHPGYIRELIHYIISIANNSEIQLFIITHSKDFLYMLTSDNALAENDIEFLKKELLILQLSRFKDDIILSNLDYNDAVSDMEDLLLDLRGI